MLIAEVSIFDFGYIFKCTYVTTFFVLGTSIPPSWWKMAYWKNGLGNFIIYQ